LDCADRFRSIVERVLQASRAIWDILIARRLFQLWRGVSKEEVKDKKEKNE